MTHGRGSARGDGGLASVVTIRAMVTSSPTKAFAAKITISATEIDWARDNW